MSKSSKKMSGLKNKCESLEKCCRNDCNKIIDLLCVCDEKNKKELCEYLRCCLALSELCCCCSCCINMNCMTNNLMSDLVNKCIKICNCCDKLKKILNKKDYNKINCDLIRKCCSSICGTKKTKSKKGGAIRH